MYFDPEPKKDLKDLYNRTEELEKFNETLEYSNLITIIGPRRTGKTSFMNVALKESNQPYIQLDLRGLSFNPSQADIIRKIEATFNNLNKKWLTSIVASLKQVTGVSILGASISLNWSKEGVNLTELFDTVNKWAETKKQKFLIAFDEIQLIRGEKEIPRLFAHIMDYNSNIRIIVTGSEIGLLFDFLGFDNPDSPLYGRYYTEINMKPFNQEDSLEFLQAGFKQTGVQPNREILEKATIALDGIVGWLTLFGTRCREADQANEAILEQVIIEGGKLARAEAQKLTQYSKRYSVTINYLAKAKKASWSQIKSIMEANEGRTLPNSTTSDILNKLIKTNLVMKDNGEYSIPDPLLINAVLKDPIPEK